MKIVLFTFLSLVFLAAQSAKAEWAEQMPLGTPFPELAATDQHGNSWSTRDMQGDNGFIFMFNRSIDW